MSKRVILIGDSNDEDANIVSTVAGELGLKPVRARRTAEVVALFRANVDVVLVDPSADGMSADELWTELGKKNRTPIIVSATDGTKEDVITAMRNGCIDWLEKPLEAEAVRNCLKRTMMRAGIAVEKEEDVPKGSRGLVKEIARRIRDGDVALPDVPEVVRSLDAMLGDENTTTEMVVKGVKRCPSLSARLVSMANTATFGGKNWEQSITDLPGAVERLGNLTIKNLLQSDVLKDQFYFKSPAFKQIFDKMWRNHYMTAALSQKISELTEIGDPNEMYLLGLLHNVGELFLLRVFGELFQRNNNQLLQMDEVLSNIRDWHTTFGAALITKWNMGDEFALITRHHHDRAYFESDDCDPDLTKKLHVANLASQFTLYMGLNYYKRPPASFTVQESYEYLNLDSDAKDTLRQQAQEIATEIQEQD